MEDAKLTIERMLAEYSEKERQLIAVIDRNEKLSIENEILRERIAQLEPYEFMVDQVPDEVAITISKEAAVKLYAVAINLFGAKADPSKARSDESKKRALNKINFVAEKMIAYVCRHRQRVHHFLVEEGMAVVEDYGELS